MRFRAAVLHRPGQPLRIETVELGGLRPGDALVRIRATSLCHTDLEVIDGQLAYPMPIVLGHEAAGTVEAVGGEVQGLALGDSVVLSWNPHCGHCFYCERDEPILCETYLRLGPQALQFDGTARLSLGGNRLHHLMFLGSFAEYCIVPAQSAVRVPAEMPFDRACLIGCGVMTGVGAAIRIARMSYGASALVIGCGAVGLSAVQGARLAGAGRIIAVDLDRRKLDLAARVGATDVIEAGAGDPLAAIRDLTGGRGADYVFEAAGNPRAFRLSAEAARPGGEIVWLGKVNVADDVAFRWGSLMGEKRIRRSSYGGARPQRDFPLLAQAYLDGMLKLDELVSRRIALEEINDGFAALKRGEVVRAVVTFDA
ncbi:MAG TPA: Zn-dependent alcohol dehydrogenase [Stellaceae bacterium]|nr:Zn-dependent alcohol dehydrogenase [Stellaceae bacterium]